MGQLTFARILRSNCLPVNFSDLFFVQKIRVHVWEVRHMTVTTTCTTSCAKTMPLPKQCI